MLIGLIELTFGNILSVLTKQQENFHIALKLEYSSSFLSFQGLVQERVYELVVGKRALRQV